MVSVGRQHEKGVAAVEFAIVIPLVILLCAGGVAIGNAWRTQVRMESAANEAARLCGVRRGNNNRQTCTEALLSPNTLSANCTSVTADIKTTEETTFDERKVLRTSLYVECDFALLPGISGVPPIKLKTRARGVAN